MNKHDLISILLIPDVSLQDINKRQNLLYGLCSKTYAKNMAMKNRYTIKNHKKYFPDFVNELVAKPIHKNQNKSSALFQ